MKEKKQYRKPLIKKVVLKTSEKVLKVCKVEEGVTGPGSPSYNCYVTLACEEIATS